MPAIDATVGTPTANSYVTVAEADSYFDASYGRNLWTATLPDAGDKNKLLINASRALDSFMEWEGFKANPTQSMEWPRTGTYDKTGAPYAVGIIPMPIKFAVYELAYYLLQNGGLNFADQSVERVKVGPIDIDFAKTSVDSGIPKFIEQLIAHIGTPVLSGGLSAYTAKVIRS